MTPHTDEKTDWANKNWQPGTITHPFQEDSFNCGVFVMLMAKQVVEEFPEIPAIINITPSTEMMSQYRKSLAKEILLASGVLLHVWNIRKRPNRGAMHLGSM